MLQILYIAGGLIILTLLTLVLLRLRQIGQLDLNPLMVRLDCVERGQGKVDRAIRDELSQSRQELSSQSKELRTELTNSLTAATDSVLGQTAAVSSLTQQRLDSVGSSVEQRLTRFTEDTVLRMEGLSKTLGEASYRLQDRVGHDLSQFRLSLEQGVEGVHAIQKQQTHSLVASLESFRKQFEDSHGAFSERFDSKVVAVHQLMDSKLDQLQTTLTAGSQQGRTETLSALNNFSDSVLNTLTEMTRLQSSQFDDIRQTVDSRLGTIQSANEQKLEEMRLTVDEKLQGTLEARLGASFTLVSERLEQVHRGLGEMQTLAAGVGDLKKVLTNVKTRGTWGEVQLGNILEQLLSPEQYEENVATTGTGERVEFAIKFPSKDDKGSPFWLPIDSKFPLEDYQRLLEASERGDTDALETASRQLESSLKQSARMLRDKYVAPPATTDFGILFLPTEGLYAEALRRAGLAEFIQREYRVVLAGPTTLAAILNSLQMGFRTLAIQRRSSEVWQLLGATKTEFGKYADVLGKVKKKLDEASNTIDKAAVRTRAIERTLRAVEKPDCGAGVFANIDQLEPVDLEENVVTSDLVED